MMQTIQRQVGAWPPQSDTALPKYAEQGPVGQKPVDPCDGKPPVQLREVNVSALLRDPAAAPFVKPIRQTHELVDQSIDRHAPRWRSVPPSFYAMWILPFRLDPNTVLGSEVDLFDMGRLSLEHGANGRVAITRSSVEKMVEEWPGHIAKLRSRVQGLLSRSEITLGRAQQAYWILDGLQAIVDRSAKPLLAAFQNTDIGKINTDVVTAAIGRN